MSQLILGNLGSSRTSQSSHQNFINLNCHSPTDNVKISNYLKGNEKNITQTNSKKSYNDSNSNILTPISSNNIL